ncbi:CoA transferase [Pseudomonas chlororaphis]|uniref:L-carnitine dehydratase/bile acid-inducible protein F n=1 Tax=Pseudomonas chlororaphis TaxID=587753 RepID=A0AAX3FSV5_9PSED|nr:CoA transferase [Pseudomonas chlororaphis]AZC39350.1 CAIB/BAIF family protein [Pseudomonas chlororaphis subsp. piscium]AZC45902.1 CAIB/BAIF family protein [Pseudomonas chlororaphis subsp. piscium]AZC52635.1 CAIB/BAIF family protein [Pseudomonas chlororaphis subsp. piscium]AZC65218.1 CAIB/BAIF family protein [Pseudomonas chlororaphis subsp. piscium]AZC71458.1 CAIB/BAIF family protein [Pseudomonas chlororaphis subsp. piscium]
MTDVLSSVQAALGLPLTPIALTSSGALPSAFAVTELASASIAAAGQAAAGLLFSQTGRLPALSVDRRLASFWFATSLRPLGWSVPPLWDPVAGDYATQDGWIRLHTNAPHHRQAAEQVLGRAADRPAMAAKVAQWNKSDLEQAVVAAGGCAAEMRSWAEWQAHPQGQAVNAEPLVHYLKQGANAAQPWRGSLSRPLAGIKVLDLTRVLAGPIASRFLAGLGADVLRIDPPEWNEPGVVPEVTLGKRCARLNLHDAADRQVFDGLLSEADLLLHGYRADALERLGYGAAERQRLAPGLIDVCLNAYGWSGPWQNRRGFDSLVQMSSGIAEAGQRWQQANKPVPLPVQALDHATGYLMAAAAIRLLTQQLQTGAVGSARLSLARTAKLLIEHSHGSAEPALRAEDQDDQGLLVEQTSWGPAYRLQVPLQISGTPLQWAYPASDLGAHRAKW